PDALYENGMRLIISGYRRSTTNPAMRHKTANFLVPIMARQEASRKDAHDALFLNTEGDVCEGTVWNIFVIKGSRVITPPLEANLLPGITRETVLKICADTGIAASEGLFGAERLLAADEVFVTSSLMEVMPVASINDRCIGQKIPANITRRLMGEYKKLTLI
ncbi:MAG: aminotransferase class IV, partial [Candidatus Brocadiales bacterium]